MKIILLILLSLLITGCISQEKTTEDSDSSNLVLEKGDTVKVDYIGRIQDTGEVFDTTYAKVASNPSIKKMDRFVPKSQYEPLEFTLGQGQMLPAFEEGLLGMKTDEEKNLTLTPEEGYGNWSNEFVITSPRVVVLPRVEDVPISLIIGSTGKEPELNESIQLNYWTARVINISGSNATLLHEPDDNTTITTVYGPAVVNLNDTQIITTILPELGAVVTTYYGEGVISDVNETDFIIDFNYPLAGKKLVFEVRVVYIIKAGQTPEKEQ